MGDLTNGYQPLHVEPRCKVCNSTFRPLVDQLYAAAYRPTAIARLVQRSDSTLTIKSIERHCKRHLDLNQEVLREIIERRAEEAKILGDEARSRIVTKNAVLDAMIQKGWDQISEPEAKVYYKDVISAIELQSRIEHDEIQAVADDLQRQLRAIIQATQEIVDPKQFKLLVDRTRAIYESPVFDFDVAEQDFAELPPSKEEGQINDREDI